MMENQSPLTSPDGSSNGNPPERCPRPLFSRDSTQEDHTIPHHHQSGNLWDDNIDVKEEYKEEDEMHGVMEEFSEGHKNMVEPPNTRNPPERCPHPLYSRDSTQEGYTIPHHHQGEQVKDIKVEVKVEKEEKSGDLQSMVEGDPLYSRDSTQEDHTIPHHQQGERFPPRLCSIQEDHTILHHHQGEERINIKAEVKEEEVETYVGGDQPFTEEVGMIMKSEQEDISLPFDT
ncbi:hypothetical protein AB205_0174420, partial [Aquarana catesbeiana]